MNAKSNSNSGSTTLVIVALTLALLAVVLTNVYIGMVRTQADADRVEVYVLDRTLYPGEKLKDRDITLKRYPGEFREIFANRVADPSVRVGDTIMRLAEQGAPLTHDLFTPPEERDLVTEINEGMRVYALPVDNRTAPGNLKPGMLVDLEAPFRISGREAIIVPVMERVRVLAVGRRDIVAESQDNSTRSRPISSFNTISIELTPLQATQMSMIQRMAVGEFILHLRNPGDAGTPKIPRGGINERLLEMLPETVLPEGVNLSDDLDLSR